MSLKEREEAPNYYMLAVKLQFIPASHDEDIKQKDLTFHTLLKKIFSKSKSIMQEAVGAVGESVNPVTVFETLLQHLLTYSYVSNSCSGSTCLLGP